jgi:broad specificity phosphatase PhoE
MTAEIPPVRLVLARHGETEWSRDGRHTGRTDVPLTEVGRRQAVRLGKMLAGRTFERVISSPLVRATETARLAGFGDRLEIDEDLREWDYGIYEGRTSEDIAAEVPGWTIWSHPIVGGESLADVARRADMVIASLLGTRGDSLIFAHGHLLRVLGARWIEEAPEAGARLVLSTATVSELAWDHDQRAIETWNVAPGGEGH